MLHCGRRVTHRILRSVTSDATVLTGKHIRLEPLDRSHIGGLVAAAAVDPSLYRWTPVPQGALATTTYVETALAWRDAGIAVPFAIACKDDGLVLGSTRFFNLDRWSWPQDHPRHGGALDACEIGYTWLTRAAIRTAANTEAKLLMLTYAFESWRALRVCFHTDARNQRSRAALERLGAEFEGILRSHRMAADFIPRDSACYSIVVAEWPDVKQRLTQLLDQPRSGAESTQD
jgi:RimJ/RimL family protein N-acetyltransferase